MTDKSPATTEEISALLERLDKHATILCHRHIEYIGKMAVSSSPPITDKTLSAVIDMVAATAVIRQLVAERSKRYFVGHDNSCHSYVVPCDEADAWHAWQEIPEDDERSWNEPEFARRFEGYLTFALPETEPRR